jgi:hypothetical protein
VTRLESATGGGPHPATDAPRLRFEEVVARFPSEHRTVRGRSLSIPHAPHPFVPPTLRVESLSGIRSPLDGDVLVVSAPAAAGKSAFARALGAAARLPLLNLADVAVSADSLRAILAEEIGATAVGALQRGRLPVIVDALDAGAARSGDRNFEEFLRTAFRLLGEDAAAPRGTGPKLLLVGRTDAVETAAAILDVEAPDLPASWLALDDFDEPAAVRVILDYAQMFADAPEKLRRLSAQIGAVTTAFFDAVGAAIGVADIWSDERGQRFAGSAPVLATLGALIARTDDYVQLERRLRAPGATDPWDVLERVADDVLERQAARVQRPLGGAVAVPAEAYGPVDQVHLLTGQLTGRTFQASSRLAFPSPASLAAYREGVRRNLSEHPFLRGGVPVNDVLGALILGRAIAYGADLSGGQVPRLLATYRRQPFLWRFCRRQLAPGASLTGESGAILLASLWSDEILAGVSVTIQPGPAAGSARLSVEVPGDALEVDILPPLVLRHEVRDLSADLDEHEIVVRGWPEANGQAMRFLGQVRISARAFTFEVDRLQIGALGIPAFCRLSARRLVNDHRLTIAVQDGSVLTVGAAFVDRRPREGVAPPVGRSG